MLPFFVLLGTQVSQRWREEETHRERGNNKESFVKLF